MQTTANAVIYARYSSDKQTEQSIEGQLRYCNQYAQMHGYSIIGNYIDRAISGTSDNRPQFQQMIADSAKKQFQFIIVWKLDRFARNRYDSAIYKNKLKKNGVKVISATEGIGEGNESIILEAVLEAMAETYSKQLSENVRRGMKESALKGNSTGGTVPLGYKIENGKLTIEEKEAEIVKYVFEEYAAGTKKSKIIEDLNNKGYRTRQGKKYSINSFTSTFFHNKKYIGLYHYNDIEVEGACPAIVDEETFIKCQKRAEQNKRQRGHNKAKIEYLLSGKLFCGHCGAKMTGDCGTSKNKTKHYYYACTERRKNGTCDKMREDKGFIEWYVVEQTVNYVLTPVHIDYIAQRIVGEYEKEFSQSGIKELEEKLQRLNREYDRLADSLINAKSQRMIDTINSKAAELELQIADVEEQLASLKIVAAARISEDEIKEWLRRFCRGDLMDEQFRRQIIDVFINSIYLYDDKVVIYYNVKDCKQVSYIEMLDETKDIFEGLQCSDFNCDSPPETPC